MAYSIGLSASLIVGALRVAAAVGAFILGRSTSSSSVDGPTTTSAPMVVAMRCLVRLRERPDGADRGAADDQREPGAEHRAGVGTTRLPASTATTSVPTTASTSPHRVPPASG